jgi:hypothetical protein
MDEWQDKEKSQLLFLAQYSLIIDMEINHQSYGIFYFA